MVVFPWSSRHRLCYSSSSLRSRLLSQLYNDVTRSFFLSPVPPHLRPRPRPRPLTSAYFASFLPPCLTSSLPSSTRPPPPLFLLRPSLGSHLTTPVFGHKSRTCPPRPANQSAKSTRLPLHVPCPAPPNRLFHWKRSRPLASHSPPRPLLLPYLLSPHVRMSAVPPTLHQDYSTVKHTYNTLRSDRFSANMKRESSPSLFSFSSRTQRCSDGNSKPLPIHHHPILSGTSSGYLLPSQVSVWALQGRGCFSHTCCLSLPGQRCLSYEFANCLRAWCTETYIPIQTIFSHLDTVHDSSRFGNDVTECLLHPRWLASATCH